MAHVLVVDDEKNIRITVTTFLREAGLFVESAENADVAIELLAARDFDVVLSNIALSRVNDAELLRSIRKTSPNVQVILMTGEQNLDGASDAVRASAFDYIKNPITKSKIVRTVRNAVRIKTLDDERRRLEKENIEYKKKLEDLTDVRPKYRTESEGKSKTILKAIPDIMFTIDSDYLFKSYQASETSDLYVPPEDFIGKKVEDILPPDLAKVTIESVDKVINSQQVNRFEYSLEINKEFRHFESLMVPKDKDQVLAVICEITDCKVEEEKYKILFESAPDAYYIHDLMGNFIDGNEAAENMLGYKKSEVIGKNFLSLKLLRLKDLPKAGKNLAKNVLGENTGPDEFTLNRKDGSLAYLEVVTHPVRIMDKKVVLGIARDISKRKIAEEELRLSEERYQDFISQLNEGVYRFELNEPMNINLPVEEQLDYLYDNLLIAECNSTFAKMYGAKEQDDLLGKTLKEVQGGKGNQSNLDVMLQFVISGYKVENEITEEIDADGNLKYFSNNTIGIVKDNYLLRIWGTQTDITKNVKVDEILRKNEERFRRLSDLTYEGIIIHKSGIVIDVNPTLIRMIGYINEELVGKNFINLIIPQKYHKTISEMMQKDLSAPFEIEGIRKDGVVFPLEIDSRSIDFENEQDVQVTVIRDISRKKKSEQDIQKL